MGTQSDLYPTKRYPHFDKRVPYKKVESYVTNPERISRHGFFPFIKFDKCLDKYSPECGNKDNIKPKCRSIMYGSHIDGYIYKYYSGQLNDMYNEYIKAQDFDKCVTAYRTNKHGMSNIHFAKEVFEFIVRSQKCYIFVSDYDQFFDNLDHGYLKNKLLKLLNTRKMEDDYFNIFNSVTKYSYMYKKDIAGYYDDKVGKYFHDYKQFRLFKKKHLKRNKNAKGIPQGTAVSGILANIYMLEIDQQLNKLMKQYGGIYRRYSDDSILVVPIKNGMSQCEFGKITTRIDEIVYEGKIEFQKSKTGKFIYNNGDINEISEKEERRGFVDYLGFHFDGKNVEVRQKSIYKFERTARKMIARWQKKSIKKCSESLLNKGKIISYCSPNRGRNGVKRFRNKYRNYNFFTYIDRVDNLFGQSDTEITCSAKQQVRHLKRKTIRLYIDANKTIKSNYDH